MNSVLQWVGEMSPGHLSLNNLKKIKCELAKVSKYIIWIPKPNNYVHFLQQKLYFLLVFRYFSSNVSGQ